MDAKCNIQLSPWHDYVISSVEISIAVEQYLIYVMKKAARKFMNYIMFLKYSNFKILNLDYRCQKKNIRAEIWYSHYLGKIKYLCTQDVIKKILLKQKSGYICENNSDKFKTVFPSLWSVI